MIEEPTSPGHSGAACWQCSATANPGDAFKFRLFVASRRSLDPLGFPVKCKAATDQVTVAVPRRRKCREGRWLVLIILVCATIAGAILVPLLRNLVWPNAAPPSSLHVAHEGIGDLAIIIGAVMGFLIGLLCDVLRDRASGLRPFDSYPPLLALRQLGWHYPE